MKKILFFALIGATLFSSCKKEDKKDTDKTTPESINYTLVKKDTTANDFIVELYSESTFIEVGYNTLFVRIKNLSGEIVKNASVLFHPDMDMGQMKHGSPVLQPKLNDKNFYEGVVIFTMPSGDMGTWELGVEVNNESVVVPVEVKKSKDGTKYVGSYTGKDDEKYFVTLVKPFEWKVGMNDVSIMVHRRVNMYEYNVVEGLTIEMDPQMTSMEHGSPNNVNPTDKGAGYYTGAANFTMTGDWRLYFDIFNGEELLIEEATIDILF